MSDLLQKGLKWLDEMRAQHMATPVQYHRGGESITVQATFAQTQYEVNDDFGARVQAEVVDFLTSRLELRFGGEATLPLPGDRIVLERDGTTVTFEVMDLAGQGHYRFCEPGGHTMRIHTKET